MKKMIAVILVLAMILSLAACGKSGEGAKPDSEPAIDTEVSEDAGMTTDDGINDDNENGGSINDGNASQSAGAGQGNVGSTANKPGTNTGTKPGGSTGNSGNAGSNSSNNTTSTTVGTTLLKDFQNRIAANPATTPQDMASALLTNGIIGFKGSTMAVQSGLLTGFAAEIKGFDNGVMFAPMIGSIPFVGYVFTVPAGGDVKAFTDMLKNNANPRWNVCTEADETVVQASGNTVFFLMCPKSLEE